METDSLTRQALGGELRDGFKFRSGHLAVDLPATMVGRAKAVPVDQLATMVDLDRWLVAAGIVKQRPGSTNRDLVQARTLREALYRLELAAVRGTPYPRADMVVLNRMAEVAPPAPRLGQNQLSWSSAGVPNLLAVVARAGAELLGTDLAKRLRVCCGTGCSLLFLDTSRSGDRHWCSMSVCGNRAKARAFRRRSTAP